jgi:RHH-type rel operon transcriptional repressor/antitoxin RelB
MYDKGDIMSILSVRIPDEIHERLARLAGKTRRTKSSFINEMIETSLEEYEDAYLALERLNEKNARYLATEELEEELGL